MRLVTWNVNSVRARLERVLEWLDRVSPDIVCLQEIKCDDEAFPADAFRGRGYDVACFGQKTYNGVAILSRLPMSEVERDFPEPRHDAGNRLVAATIDGIRIVNVYVPNGRAVDSPWFARKLDWLARLRSHLLECGRLSGPLALCGDFNVAPEDRDVWDPEALRGQIHCHPDERARLAELAEIGLIDVFRRHRSEPGLFSWWDYRLGAFHRNRGLRIDHIWMSESLASRCTDVAIDREARKGKAASDHAPVVAEIAAAAPE